MTAILNMSNMIPAVMVFWAVFVVVWLVGMAGNKPSARSETMADRSLHVFGTVLAFSLLFRDPPAVRPFGGWLGLVLTVLGAMLAIWARFTLGRNWSASVTVKKDHELIRRGPYRLVRHPIYAGALLAILGTGLAFGHAQGLLAFLIALVTWKRKAGNEEQFMVEQFGEQYEQYRREVKSLVPGLL